MSQVWPEALRLVNGFRGYQLVVAACRLKLPDLVGAGEHDAAELAKLARVHAPSLRRVLRGLCAWGFFTEDADGGYHATALSDAFRSDRPGLRNMTVMLAKEGYATWGEVMYTIDTGEPAFEHLYGKSRWEKMAEDPDDAAMFNAAMVETSRRAGKDLTAAYDFDGVETVVDVAGGNGALLAAVLRHLPSATGVLFDLPAGLVGAGKLMEEAGVSDRVSLVEGNFFESVPEGADLYMLKSIVHDWDDERAVKILETCRRAMKPEARLILYERFLPETIDESGRYLGTVMSDLHMMVVLGGRERTTAEYGTLFAAAGLRLSREVRTDSEFYVVEATPA